MLTEAEGRESASAEPNGQDKLDRLKAEEEDLLRSLISQYQREVYDGRAKSQAGRDPKPGGIPNDSCDRSIHQRRRQAARRWYWASYVARSRVMNAPANLGQPVDRSRTDEIVSASRNAAPETLIIGKKMRRHEQGDGNQMFLPPFSCLTVSMARLEARGSR